MFCSLSENDEKTTFFKKVNFSLKTLSEQVEFNCDIPAKRFLLESRNFWTDCLEKMKKSQIVKKNNCSAKDSSGYVKCCSDNPVKNISTKSPNFSTDFQQQ